MLFTSMEFLLLFLPITIIVYFILPSKLRNGWLFIMSLLFYAWGEPIFVFAMLFSIVFNYLMALRIDELSKDTQANNFYRKLFLLITILINIGVLFVYKYANFVTSTLHQIFPKTREMFEATNYKLPIGISFFTFQALSYVVDVYRGIPAQKSILNVGLYISLFPQLIAGPIVRYTTVMKELAHRTVTVDKFAKGVKRFLIGFNKKVLLANTMAVVADKAFAAADLSVAMAWLGAISYALQIFFDFSGYSEMAIGLGKMFGFNFLENFNYPYISKTITEFWRRWHISLGSWFRDYIYFPLGGSRVNSPLRLVFNLSVVWLVTGIWHGANWNFIIWGALYGVLIIIEKLFNLPKHLPNYKVPEALYQCFTMLMVLFGWVLFRAPDLHSARNYLCAMFGLNGNMIIDATFAAYLRDFIVMILFGIFFSLPIAKNNKKKLIRRFRTHKGWIEGTALLIQAILFIISVSFLAMSAHNPFIYFNF